MALCSGRTPLPPLGLFVSPNQEEERVMSLGSTWKTLYDAVRALACSDGTRPHRLALAYRAMHMLTRDDFPDDELREAYTRLVHAWHPEEPQGAEGTAIPSPAVLPPDHTPAIEEQLLRLYTDVTRVEEQYYRSLRPRDL